MRFSESFLQEVAERNELVELVSRYVPLTLKAGSYWGCCPFHNEKTPSFHVIPDKQYYHCFGCGKGGSAIQFIMEMENLPFPEAVAFLAKRAGMEMPTDAPDEISRQRQRILSLNREAARYFYATLQTPQGRGAVDYLVMRRILPPTAKNFGLGCAPDSWDSLCKAMWEKGYSNDELVAAGLAKRSKNGRGVYDTFRNRLMFPVIDIRGNVIGFSGRILGDGEPKYLNSPETLVFNKSRNLFAMNLAKKSKSGYILLSEGNIDVVMLHQAGFDSAVASLGTSLTEQQAHLISQYTKKLVIAYDSDAAGQKASARAIKLVDKLDLQVRILQLPEGKDPDEFIKLKGPDAFRRLLENTEDHVAYLLARIFQQYDLSQPDQKVACIREASHMLAEIPDPVQREVYAMQLSGQTGVAVDTVKREVEHERRGLLSRAKKRYERDVTLPQHAPRAAAAPGAYTNVRSAHAEEGVVRLYYRDPSLFAHVDLQSAEFTSPVLGRFYDVLRAKAQQQSPLSLASLSADFSQDEIGLLTRVLEGSQSMENAPRALQDYIHIIREEKLTGVADDDLLALAARKRQQSATGDTGER